MRDDACMDGTLHDIIRSVPACADSRIQGFTEYHDNSGARLNPFLSSVERGHQVRGGTGTLCKVRRLAEENAAFFSAGLREGAC